MNKYRNIKTLTISLILMSAFSLTAFAAKYKVNTQGKVTNPAGTTQYSSVLNSSQDFYNNYSSKDYVNSQQVLNNYISTIDIVMDYSGSMSYWIAEAKKSMSSIITQLPSGTKIGFRVFGHNGGNNPYSPIMGKISSITKKKKGGYKVNASLPDYLGDVSGSCQSTSQIVKVAQNNPQTLLNGMNSVYIGGSTPLTLALKEAVDVDFATLSTNYPKKIVLITDGVESCGGDPCAYAKNLVKKRRDIIVDVVLVSAYSDELKCLADTTGGRLYTPSDLSSFTTSIYNSMTNTNSETQNQPQQEQKKPAQQYEYVPDN